MFQFSKFYRKQQTSQLIDSYKNKRYYDMLQERSQGFWIQDQVKSQLDKIRIRSQRIKTQIPRFHSPYRQDLQFAKRRKSTIRKPKKSYFDQKKIEPNQNLHLPELKEFINYRQTNEEQLICKKRWNILHLIIFAINRRSLGRLYQSLDLLLLASSYFQKGEREIRLKYICTQMINKIHTEIKSKERGDYSFAIRKRHRKHKRKSLFVRSILSKQKFMINFVEKIRRSKLLFESTHQRECIKKGINLIRKKSQESKDSRDKYEKIKVNGKYEIYIPEPQSLFEAEVAVGNQIGPKENQIQNYRFIVMLIDENNSRFPYEYPQSLQENINEKQYRNIVCKLNGILLPQGRCHSWNSIIKIFYLPILFIFLLSVCFSFFTKITSTSDTGRIINIFVFIILILVLAAKIKVTQSRYSNFLQISEQLKNYLRALEDQYSLSGIKFILHEEANAVIIAFPAQLSQISSTSNSLTEIQEVDENTCSKPNSHINQYSPEQSVFQAQEEDASPTHSNRTSRTKIGSNKKKVRHSRFSRLKSLNSEHSIPNQSKLLKKISSEDQKSSQISDSQKLVNTLNQNNPIQSHKILPSPQKQNSQQHQIFQGFSDGEDPKQEESSS